MTNPHIKNIKAALKKLQQAGLVQTASATPLKPH